MIFLKQPGSPLKNQELNVKGFKLAIFEKKSEKKSFLLG